MLSCLCIFVDERVGCFIVPSSVFTVGGGVVVSDVSRFGLCHGSSVTVNTEILEYFLKYSQLFYCIFTKCSYYLANNLSEKTFYFSNSVEIRKQFSKHFHWSQTCRT